MIRTLSWHLILHKVNFLLMGSAIVQKCYVQTDSVKSSVSFILM